MNRRMREALQDSEKGRAYLKATAEAKRKGRALKAETLVPLPGKTKTERREEHREATRGLRAMVFERSKGNCTCGNGHCEACSVDLGQSWELHHVQPAGHRRSRQRLGNLLALCWDCHRRAHRGDLGTLAQIARAPSFDDEARRAARHRLDKVLEVRGVPVHVEVK